jgi:hypothetical protein
MHRQLFNAVKDKDDTVTKKPEQLSIYKDCEMPIPKNDSYPENGNFYAYSHILGEDTYYSYLPVYGIN